MEPLSREAWTPEKLAVDLSAGLFASTNPCRLVQEHHWYVGKRVSSFGFSYLLVVV